MRIFVIRFFNRKTYCCVFYMNVIIDRIIHWRLQKENKSIKFHSAFNNFTYKNVLH